MKKKFLLSVTCFVALVLFIAGQKQHSIKTLVSDNVEALSLNDNDWMNMMFGIIEKHNLYDYPTSITSEVGSWYASHGDYCVDPRVQESVGYYCANKEDVDIHKIRYGEYCYTVTKMN